LVQGDIGKLGEKVGGLFICLGICDKNSYILGVDKGQGGAPIGKMSAGNGRKFE
jgi:hypothetical protein